jgi:hypothetical protein
MTSSGSVVPRGSAIRRVERARRLPLPRILLALALLLVVAAVPACHDDGGAEGGQRRVDPSFDDPDPARLIALAGASPERDVVHSAMQQAVARCMAAKGFDHATAAPAAETAGVERATVERNLLFGLDGRSEATALGVASTQDRYVDELHAADTADQAIASSVAEQGPEHQAAWDAAMAGVEPPVSVGGASIRPDGCSAQSYVDVFGSLEVGLRIEFLPGRLRSDLAERAYADPALRAPLATWRRCMADRGIDSVNPNDAYGAVEHAFQTAAGDDDIDDATDHEREVAAAYVACDRESGLFDSGWAEVPRLREELAAEHADDLALYRGAVTRAARLLDP